ncbi:EAL domain-containing protein [Methylomagnum sp.]
MSERTLSEPICLGLMLPLTGLADIYGPEITAAARIACDEINERGGVLGRSLELVIEDDGSQPATAVPAATRLIKNHHCAALVGNLLSNSRIAVATQVAEPYRVPLLNFSFYEGSIVSRHFFHFAALPNQQIDKMIPYMAEKFGLKMFFAGNNYEWPRGSIDAAKRVLENLGGDSVGERYLAMGAEPQEIAILLEHVACSGADVFVPYFAGIDQVRLLTQFTAMGLKKRMAVVMGHYDEVMAGRLPNEIREGFYSSNTYFMSLDTPENYSYLARLARLPGIDGISPHGNGVLTNFGESVYLCVQAFAQAAEMAGSTDAEALVDALERVRVRGPQGEVVMDAATHHASVNTFLARCEADGTFAIVERFGRNPPVIPPRYRERTCKKWEFPRPAVDTGIPLPSSSITHRILSLSDTAILVTDTQGFIVEANPGACLLFGYIKEELCGLSVHLLLPPQFRQQHAELLQQFVAGEETERRMAGRAVTGYRKDGSFFPLEASIAKFQEDSGWMLVVNMRDITERYRAEEHLVWQLTHDPLTNLPNRALIRERLVNALHRSQRHGLNVALLFVDLDGFKLVNDTHGHETGDGLLKAVATRLLDQVRPGDTVARLAGDEFVVLCERLEQPTTISSLAERINTMLRQAVELDGVSLCVTASIGIAVGHGTTHSADDLLRYADAAMYAVKQNGRDGWQFFSSSLHEKVRQRLSITQGLWRAIERDELSVRFQPIIAADSRRTVGAELLLRWHPLEGEISPALFIPIAEMSAAILSIGAWVFREACRAEADWRRRWGVSAPYVSVNVSARQLGEDNLAEVFAETLRDTAADPTRLLLEITETSLMADVEVNLRVLRRLAALGLRVAVDDFGTGYSSLAQLTRLPVGVLKIDRAFVDGIERQPESRAVVRAVIGLGKSLGLKLVAEGVETKAQWLELRAQGCDYMQGYLFHRPLPEQSFIDTIDRETAQEKPDAEPSIFFLLYVSQITQPMNQAEIETLVSKSNAFNQSVGITGCLVYQDGYFMQMVEGTHEHVLALRERIQRDPRHREFRVVIQGWQRCRVFENWSMAFRDMSKSNDDPDFTGWRRRTISFAELAEDARTCYAYITGR